LENEGEEVISTLGSFIDQTVFPAESLIFQRKSDQSDRFQVVYSTKNRDMVVPFTESILGVAAERNETIIINDTSERDEIIAVYERDIFNRDFIEKNNHSAAIFVPVRMNVSPVEFVFLCCFKRKNAISIIEKEILSAIAILIAHHFEVAGRQSAVDQAVAEAQRLLEMSKQAMLIANIMHDASDDLVAARDNLSIIFPRTEIEKGALKTSKDVIGEILAAAAHFRTIFGSVARQGRAGNIRAQSRVKLQEIRLYDLVAKLRAKHKEEIVSNKIYFQNKVPPDWITKCVYYLVQSAIDNVIKNSIYHVSLRTHVRRIIKITARRENGFEIISVQDNGLGVQEEQLEHICKPFFSTRGGMGLGLAIVSAAAEAHGGGIIVRSEPSKSFLVEIKLPVVGA
jgi:signal transduction histidine kinase